MEGYHVVRRSDRLWAGLSTDLVIEQMLMGSLKTVGGLTQGRGMTKSQRVLWLFSRPTCCEINEAVQELTDTTYVTSEQHKDNSEARKKKDAEDIRVMLDYLNDRNPFNKELDLKSIASGVTASESNVDKAKETGKKVLEKMNGKNVRDHIFKRCDHVIPMNDKAGLKLEGESINIDPQLLFQ